MNSIPSRFAVSSVTLALSLSLGALPACGSPDDDEGTTDPLSTADAAPGSGGSSDKSPLGATLDGGARAGEDAGDGG
ncbi:MAG: hypothetical protein JWP97_6204, partial [Labilithrix sp.]|nr:hypothetical protein [Labilithrix sp.]